MTLDIEYKALSYIADYTTKNQKKRKGKERRYLSRRLLLRRLEPC